MATIFADPNPVGVYNPFAGGETTITWDMEEDGSGKVWLSINGLPEETELPGQEALGAQTGTLPLQVRHLNLYKLTLYRYDDDAVMANVLVSTFDVRDALVPLHSDYDSLDVLG